MEVKCLLNSLAILLEFLTVLLPIWVDVMPVVRFLDILMISLIPSHVLNKFNLFSQKKLLKWFALLFWVSLSSNFL